MIDNNKFYNEYSLIERIDIALYCLNQLFSYCLIVENEDYADDLDDFEININPLLYLSKTKELLRGIKVSENKINKLKDLNTDTVDILDNISLEINHKYRSILKDYEIMDIYDNTALSY